MATERINIIVTAKGTVTVKKEIEDIGNSSKKTAAALDLVKGAVAGLITAGSISQLLEYGDTFVSIQNRLSLVTSGSEQLAAATQNVYNIAQDARVGYEGLATVYSRTATSTQALGVSTDQLNSFTEQLAKSVALSGVAAESANAGLVQLSQGMAAGALRGEELNSVLEQLPYVAKTLADGMGVAVGSLKSLAEQGQITPQVIIDAFAKMNNSINANFAQSLPTISQGLTVINNAFIQLAGVVQTNTGLFGYLGQALVLIGNNLNVVLVALSPLAVALAAFATEIIGGMLVSAVTSGIAAMTAFGRTLITVGTTIVTTIIPAVIALAGRIAALAVTLAVNPWTIFIAGAVAAAAAIYGIINGFDALEAKVNAVVDAAKQKFDEFKKETEGLLNFGNGKAPEIQFNTADLIKTMTTANKDLDKTFKDGGKTLQKSVKEGADSGAQKYKTALELANAGTEKAITNGFDKGAQKQTNVNDVFVAKFEGTGRNIYDLWNNWGNAFVDSFGTTLGQLLGDFQRAQTAQLEAQAELFKAQADQIRQEMDYLHDHGYKPGEGPPSQNSSSSSTTGNVGRGGPGTVSTSSGTMDTDIFRRKPDQSQNQDAANNNNQQSTQTTSTTKPTTTVNVVLDPALILQTLNSASGQNIIKATVANNPDIINSRMGIA